MHALSVLGKDCRRRIKMNLRKDWPHLVSAARASPLPVSSPSSPTLSYSSSASLMDQSTSYQGHSSHQSRQQQLFPQGQLPPPSQLHLPMPSFSRMNTLPPISSMPSDSRYPPPSYHPSLSPQTGPPLPSSSSSHHPWPTHRTSSSREEVHPSRRRETKGKAVDVESHHERGLSVQPSQETSKDTEDGMPSTSDFVKKLYK